MKHPTPWVCSPVVGGTGTVSDAKTFCVFSGADLATTALIVRCVNAHEDLVAACKRARAALHYNQFDDSEPHDGSRPIGCKDCEAVREIDGALALAGESQ